jgi:hypothetical protein
MSRKARWEQDNTVPPAQHRAPHDADHHGGHRVSSRLQGASLVWYLSKVWQTACRCGSTNLLIHSGPAKRPCYEPAKG